MDLPNEPVLIIGHRAGYYALEHLVNNADLENLLLANWYWQPDWLYHYEA